MDPILAPQAGAEGAGAGFQVGSVRRVIFVCNWWQCGVET